MWFLNCLSCYCHCRKGSFCFHPSCSSVSRFSHQLWTLCRCSWRLSVLNATPPRSTVHAFLPYATWAQHSPAHPNAQTRVKYMYRESHVGLSSGKNLITARCYGKNCFITINKVIKWKRPDVKSCHLQISDNSDCRVMGHNCQQEQCRSAAPLFAAMHLH